VLVRLGIVSSFMIYQQRKYGRRHVSWTDILLVVLIFGVAIWYSWFNIDEEVVDDDWSSDIDNSGL